MSDGVQATRNRRRWDGNRQRLQVSGCFERSKGALRRVDKGAPRKGGPYPKRALYEGGQAQIKVQTACGVKRCEGGKSV